MPITLGRSKYDHEVGGLLSGYGGLSWVGRNRYDPEDFMAHTSGQGVGRIRGTKGLSFQHVYDLVFEPGKYTSIAPQSRLTSPVLRGQTQRLRTGQFQLDQVNWVNNLAQLTGPTIGNKNPYAGDMTWDERGPQPTVIDPMLDFFAARDMDMTNAPRRLLDYAFSPIAALGALDPNAPDPVTPTDGDQPKLLPFQQSPFYWQWLRDSTPEQRRQQAQYVADSRVDRVRNGALAEMLAKQFEDDYGSLDARSSGDDRIDYLAKLRIQSNPAGYAAERALTANDWSLVAQYPEAQRIIEQVQGASGLQKWNQYQQGQQGSYDWSQGLGGLSALFLPLVGDDLARAVTPISPETEDAWERLTPEQRSGLLQGYGMAAMTADMAIMFPALGGAGKAIQFLGDAKKVESLLSATRYADYAARIGAISQGTVNVASAGLNAINWTMGVGLANMTISWGLQAAAPFDSPFAEAGRRMDAARPISSSMLAGVLNEAGFWTGFYGVGPLATMVKRSVGGALTAPIAGRRLFGGLADGRFHSLFGGSPLATVFEREYGISRQRQGATESALFKSALINSEKETLARAKQAIDEGRPTGTYLDAIEDPLERAKAWEAAMAIPVEHATRRIMGQVDLFNNSLMGKLGRESGQIAREMDDRVARYVSARYGAVRSGVARLVDVRAEVQRRLDGLTGGKADLRAIERYAGKDIEKWLNAERKTNQLLYHQRHEEMFQSAVQAGEDASRFGLFSRRTLFQDEVDDYIVQLADAEQGAMTMRRLIDGKDDIAAWEADGLFSTPEELAGLLEEVGDSLPVRRALDGTGSRLDDFQEMLDGEELWAIGYKTEGVFIRSAPKGWLTIAEATPETFGQVRTPATVEWLRANGYRQPVKNEKMRGSEFLRREPIWPIHEYGGGVWIKSRPGDPSPGSVPSPAEAYAGPKIEFYSEAQENLMDPGYYPSLTTYGIPYASDLEPVLRPGTESVILDPEVSAPWIAMGGVSGIRVHAATTLAEHGIVPTFGVKDLDAPPVRSVDEMADDWHNHAAGASEPPPIDAAGDEIWKSGVIVREAFSTPEGMVASGVWALHPKNLPDGSPFSGYDDLTFAKGGFSPSDRSLRETAARELREEMGFDADFEGWIGDFTDEYGVTVRYYAARRNSGGLAHALTPDETGHLELLDPARVRDRLVHYGQPGPRDTAALDAFFEHRGYVKTVGEEMAVSGFNPGANWPVLKDKYSGERFVFKAMRGFPIKDLDEAMRLTAPLAAKLFKYLGLGVSAEVPFVWNGVKGTLQPFVDNVDEVLLRRGLTDLPGKKGSAPVIEELQRQHLADWFVSQHDSNAPSQLRLDTGEVVSVDKGQSWKFFGNPEETEAFLGGKSFWTYEPNPNETLGSYLYEIRHALSRQAVESVVQKIEALDDQVMRGWLGRLADERAASGFSPSGEDFIDSMLMRRDTFRMAVNSAYEALGQMGIPKPGELAQWKPGLKGAVQVDGGSVWINDAPKSPQVAPDFVDRLGPELTDGQHFVNAGVIIEETDGRVWALQLGNRRTLPVMDLSGNLQAATPEELQASAHAVAMSEMGMSIRLEEVVGDTIMYDVDGDFVTHWYRATRTGGGPEFAGKHVTGVMLGSKSQVREGMEDAWGTDGLDALDKLREPRAAEPPPIESPVDQPIPERRTGNEYVSYKVLPNGQVYRSPWTDYPIDSADDVLLGNRAVLSHKLDQVFQGWRASRILELQKGVLYRRLDGLSASFTATRVARFHEGLLELARKHGFAGIQPLGTAEHWVELPGLGNLYKETEALAESVFGRGPFLSRDGREITVDWGREIAKAYRTSMKLNLTAGLTSNLKAMGWVGSQASFVADLVYPSFRFALSPLFKAGEWAEAWMLNGMRGVNPFGMDDVQRSLWHRNGLATSGAEYIEESMSDPMLAAAGRSTTRDRALKSSFMRQPVPDAYAAEVAARRNGPEAPMTAADQVPNPRRGLNEAVFPSSSAPVREFDDVPTHGVEAMIPHHVDPDSGIPVFDVERIRELDAQQVQKTLKELSGRLAAQVISRPEAADSLGWAVGWMRSSFTDDELRRLAQNVPIIHTTGSGYGRSFDDKVEAGLDDIEDWLETGKMPLTGPAGRDQIPGVQTYMVRTGEPSMVVTGDRPQTSVEEQLAGFVDAPYAGAGLWHDGVGFVLRNERVIPRSVMMDTDRIGSFHEGPVVAMEKHAIFPNGAVDVYDANLRYAIVNSAHDGIAEGRGRPLAEALGSSGQFFNTTSPIEHAIPGGGTWEDIAAVIIPAKDDAARARWAALVATYGDSVPGLRDIEVVDRDMADIWRFTFQRAGLSDRAMAMPSLGDIEAGRVPSLIPDELITPQTIVHVEGTLADRLRTIGGEVNYRISLEDRIRAQIGALEKAAGRIPAKAAADLTTSGMGNVPLMKEVFQEELAAVPDQVRKVEEQIVLLQDLLDEVEEWRDWTRASNLTDDAIEANEEFASFMARARAMKVEEGPGLDWTWGPTSRFEILDRNSPRNQVMADSPSGDLPPGSVWDHRVAASDEQRVAAWREVNDWMAARSAATESFPVMFDAAGGRELADAIAPAAFVDELQRLASLKTGRAEDVPQVKVWLRGDHEGLIASNEMSEVIITVSYPDGTFPLSLQEIEDAWLAKGLPDRTAAGGTPDAPPDHALAWVADSEQASAMWTPESAFGHRTGSVMLGSASSWSVPEGSWMIGPSGKWEFRLRPGADNLYISQRPVHFLYGFEMGPEMAAWSLTDDVRVWRKEALEVGSIRDVPGHDDVVSGEMIGDRFRYTLKSGSRDEVRWAYGVYDGGGYWQVRISSQTKSTKDAEEAIRDAIAGISDRPIQLVIRRREHMAAVTRMSVLGDLPDGMVIAKRGDRMDPIGPYQPGHIGDKFAEDVPVERLRLTSLPKGHSTAAPPPDSLEEAAGSAEFLTSEVEREWRAQIAAAPAATRERMARGWQAFMNPVPAKQRQQDRLIRDLTRSWFPDVLERSSPNAYRLIHEELGVPRDQIVDYLLDDRALLQEWVRTGREEDFAALVAHADRYGIAAGDARAALDSLHESPDWTTVLDAMHWTSKAATSESFGVHFFNQYRSTFERSINHPLLGVYPASWAYKVAKEWFRFLYQNETLGFRMGMNPARFIAQVSSAQQVAFARDEGGDLDQWYEDGPLSSSIFVFNLLMPGDWSNIPFPLSRSLRDLLRGNLNPVDHLQANLLQMGLGRDIRLTNELANEWWTLATGATEGRRPAEYEVTADQPLRR